MDAGLSMLIVTIVLVSWAIGHSICRRMGWA